MVIGMRLFLRIDAHLPLAEARQRLVGVVADLQTRLSRARRQSQLNIQKN